ncbi:MAG: helix-turn-helix domain-containing protein [Pseudomonas sp.]|uniref:helix-turn-helix domain-containing protein n=1 Tax=Pseudomonas sp. TaxID=306 RepID=UPI003BB6D7F7
MNELKKLFDDANARLDNREAAAYLKVSPNTLDVWRSEKRFSNLPYIKIGSRVFYWKRDLDAFLLEQTVREVV